MNFTTTIEQLACILGTPDNEATLILATELYRQFKSINHIFSASRENLLSIANLTPLHYQRFQAMKQLIRQYRYTQLIEHPIKLDEQKRVIEFLHDECFALEREIFVGLFFNTHLHLIAYEEIALDTIGQSRIYPREVLKLALRHNAANVIFAHNHPSNYAEPSAADIKVTKDLIEILDIIDVTVLDHLIITRTEHTSLMTLGVLE